MKKLLIIFLCINLYSIASVVKSNDQRALGEKIFNKKNCKMCHKLTSSSTGPSITRIAKIYSGKESQLIRFLEGKKKPIMNPKKSHIMKGQLSRIKALNRTKIKAIARYIVTINDREF